MTWTNYNLGGLQQVVTPPLEGSDGNMWVASGVAVGSVSPDFAIQTPGGGAPTVVAGPVIGNGVISMSNLVTDGTYMALAVSSNFPQSWLSNIAISGHTVGTLHPTASFFGTFGAVQVGSNSYAFGGDTNYPEAWEWPIATGVLANLNTYTALANPLGCPVQDGTNFWSALCGTTTMYAIPISTFGANTFTSYTITAATLSLGSSFIAPQTGFDGRYMYLAANAGGVIIFDTVAHTSNLVGATAFVNCYYSANLGLVLLDDTSGNIYTMPAGSSGGSFTNIGNSTTITGDPLGSANAGFGDGPAGTLWGSANNTSATIAYMYSYVVGVGMQILMMP